MEQTQIKQFQQMLECILEGFGQTLRVRDEIAVERVADSIDQIDNATGRELAARRLDLHARRLTDAIGALKRIKDGTYGICLECESEIEPKRLNAVPWTCYCIACQEQIEQIQRGNTFGNKPMPPILCKSPCIRPD